MNIEFDLNKQSTANLRAFKAAIDGVLEKRERPSLQKGQVWQDVDGDRFLVIMTREDGLSFLILTAPCNPLAISSCETYWELERIYAPGDTAPDTFTRYLGEWEELTNEH